MIFFNFPTIVILSLLLGGIGGVISHNEQLFTVGAIALALGIFLGTTKFGYTIGVSDPVFEERQLVTHLLTRFIFITAGSITYSIVFLEVINRGGTRLILHHHDVLIIALVLLALGGASHGKIHNRQQ